MEPIGERLYNQWQANPRKIDWLAFEQMLVDVLQDETSTDKVKVAACKEVIDAYTRRGYFDVSEYIDTRGFMETLRRVNGIKGR